MSYSGFLTIQTNKEIGKYAMDVDTALPTASCTSKQSYNGTIIDRLSSKLGKGYIKVIQRSRKIIFTVENSTRKYRFSVHVVGHNFQTVLRVIEMPKRCLDKSVYITMVHNDSCT